MSLAFATKTTIKRLKLNKRLRLMQYQIPKCTLVLNCIESSFLGKCCIHWKNSLNLYSTRLHSGSWKILGIDVQAMFCHSLHTCRRCRENWRWGFCVQFMISEQKEAKKSREGMKETPEGLLLCSERKATSERKYRRRQRERCYFHRSAPSILSDTSDHCSLLLSWHERDFRLHFWWSHITC